MWKTSDDSLVTGKFLPWSLSLSICAGMIY